MQNLGKELLDVLKVVWNYMVVATQWLINKLQKISWPWVRRAIAVIIVVLTSLSIIVNIIVNMFVLGDPIQTERLVASISGIYLFDHVTATQYVAFVAGGLVMKLATLTLAMWFGIWLYGGTNWFSKPRYAWVYASLVGFVGLAMMFGALFYAGPQLIELGKEVHQKHHLKHHMKNNQLYQHRQYQYPNRTIVVPEEILDLQKHLEQQFNWY